MSEVVPIRPGMATAGSRADAFCDWCAENIKMFATDDEPISIAICLIGKKSAGAVAWAGEGHASEMVMAYAAALFSNRASLLDD